MNPEREEIGPVLRDRKIARRFTIWSDPHSCRMIWLGELKSAFSCKIPLQI